MAARGRGAAVRWSAVGALVAALVALPSLLGALPATDTGVSAAGLRAAVLASDEVGFSGYAVSAGGLSLPVTDQLTSVADLFSDRTSMRVWWRGPADHRVDVLTATGETGTHRDALGTWTWEYESATARRTVPGPLELPAPPDLLPSTLGARLLSEASADELSRVGARRVAGRDGLGLRVVPAARASSVERVDVWVDGDSGLPLQVEVFAKGSARAALDTRFLDLELAVPDAEVTAFSPPESAGLREDGGFDLVAAARQITGPALPLTLAGLDRRPVEGLPRGLAVYGRGVTLLAVVPAPGRLAGELRRALHASPGAVVDELGVRASVGPLGLMVVDRPGGRPYVLTGTVTTEALAAAAADMPELGGRP
ncbi:LolA-like protein [Blastococcus deserti]|uniref:Transcriptional regulator n=1 Tax=Blastococcus deserti TaxID=2259033 RepID=A0ABW4XDI8_9ACTN